MRPVSFCCLNPLINTEQNRSEFRMAIDEPVNIQLKLDLFSWASLFYLIFELYLQGCI